MNTFPLHPKILPPTIESIRFAADALREGELIGLPTETVYGLAARADQSAAVSKIFGTKGRPATNPLIVHVANAKAARELVRIRDKITERRFELASSLWPGSLTLVLPRQNAVIDLVTAGGDTVGVRVPNHPVALDVLRAVDFPVAAPSANVSNYISPTRPEHVTDALESAVVCVLDGGKCDIGLESTVLSLADPSIAPNILRSGSISVSCLQETLGENVTWTKHVRRSKDNPLPAPGQLAKHYSPRTTLHVVPADALEPERTLLPNDGASNERVLRIQMCPSDRILSGYAETWVLSPVGDLNEIANRFYEELRRADVSQFDRIEIDEVTIDAWHDSPNSHLVSALSDRIWRAADRD